MDDATPSLPPPPPPQAETTAIVRNMRLARKITLPDLSMKSGQEIARNENLPCPLILLGYIRPIPRFLEKRDDL